MSYTFIAYDSVRALLGVSSKELPDSVLSDPLYANRLKLELVDIDQAIEDKYATAQGETSEAAKSFVAAFDIFVVCAMGLFCLPALPMFSPKSVTDGKASFSRYSDSPYRETVSKLEAEYDKYRKELVDALAVYDGGSASDYAPLTFAVVSSPSYDPVTGG